MGYELYKVGPYDRYKWSRGTRTMAKNQWVPRVISPFISGVISPY